MRRIFSATFGAIGLAALLAGCSSSSPTSAPTSTASINAQTVAISTANLTPLGSQVRSILKASTAKITADENIPVPASTPQLQAMFATVATDLRATAGQLRALSFPPPAQKHAAALELGLTQLAAAHMSPVPQTTAQKLNVFTSGVYCAQQAMGNGIARLTYVVLNDLRS